MHSSNYVEQSFFGNKRWSRLAKLPSEFVGQWGTYLYYFKHGGVNWASLAVAGGAMALMLLMRQFVPRIPHYIVAVIAFIIVY